jgi:hypothetical protein
MKQGYEAWFRDVAATRGFAPPRIHLGSDKENPVVLTRQDWRGPKAGWAPKSIGHWDTRVEKAGAYEIKVIAPKDVNEALVSFDGDLKGKRCALANGAAMITLELPAGPLRLAPVINANDTVGARYLEVRRLR